MQTSHVPSGVQFSAVLDQGLLTTLQLMHSDAYGCILMYIDVYIDKDSDEPIISFIDTALRIGNLGKLKDAEKINNDKFCEEFTVE